jgi:hypothetical protein
MVYAPNFLKLAPTLPVPDGFKAPLANRISDWAASIRCTATCKSQLLVSAVSIRLIKFSSEKNCFHFMVAEFIVSILLLNDAGYRFAHFLLYSLRWFATVSKYKN